LGLLLGLGHDSGQQCAGVYPDILGDKIKSNSNLQSGRIMEQELNDLLQHLEIREDEEQGIVLEEDLENLKAEAR